MKNNLEKFKQFEADTDAVFGGRQEPFSVVNCCFNMCKDTPFAVFENCMDFCLDPRSDSCMTPAE